MELLQLRYFLVAAQYQHMTKAAEQLQIAQPALSQAIHRLEIELGVSGRRLVSGGTGPFAFWKKEIHPAG